jgi:hypothetical protein
MKPIEIPNYYYIELKITPCLDKRKEGDIKVYSVGLYRSLDRIDSAPVEKLVKIGSFAVSNNSKNQFREFFVSAQEQIRNIIEADKF